jgi:hypothetical protein
VRVCTEIVKKRAANPAKIMFLYLERSGYGIPPGMASEKQLLLPFLLLLLRPEDMAYLWAWPLPRIAEELKSRSYSEKGYGNSPS